MTAIRSRLVEWASAQAVSLLAPLGNRWIHVQGVVSLAQEIGPLFDKEDRQYLLAAAYMHDIAYAPSLVVTGFHPLDGALYLRSCDNERLASLVAHHTEARFEADLRGLGDALAAFPRERSAVADALIYCDSLTGPIGQRMTLRERRLDILERYGEDHVVYRAFNEAYPYICLAVARTNRRKKAHNTLN